MSDDKENKQEREKPKRSVFPFFVLAGGTAGSIFAGSAIKDITAKKLKEIDPKSWRSNLAMFVTTFIGLSITHLAFILLQMQKKESLKQENNDNKDKQVKIIKEPTLANPIIASDTTWQDKTKKTQDTQPSIGV